MPKKQPIKFKSPASIRNATSRAMNDILDGDKPCKHYGVLASLANTWLSAKKLELEMNDWKDLQKKVDELIERSERERWGQRR